ncbi:hypothetical protein HYX00_04290 [Candidatus Woesearchaeota archaeon]|nr:hypothetical protein [Candidatus Woesearchaeota archaeon]
MMQVRDWISGLVGIIIGLLGLLPMIGYGAFLKDLSPNILRWVVVVAGAYLLINSFIEITNSNIIGWWSFGIAVIAAILGLLPTLPWFKFELFSNTVYNVVLIVEGVFLMIATFAMEL